MEDKPDFVNNEGVKWWVDKGTTQYARGKDSFGTQLLDVTCFKTELDNGYRSFVIVNGRGIVFTSQQIDTIGRHIDIMKMIKRFK
uniref:Uncharacterized protein n=1 Tax=viral metagenome TaxID=1070528 RepID=A0A6M3JLL2_9ZZZZ